MSDVPRVGVAVILIKDDLVLVGKRLNSHGSGCWGFPGGHLEFNESIHDCAVRDVFEETGLEVKNVRDFVFTNDFFVDVRKHFVTLFVLADYVSGTPKVLEPDKCEEWCWFSWDDLPKPLFLPIENLLKKNVNPFN